MGFAGWVMGRLCRIGGVFAPGWGAEWSVSEAVLALSHAGTILVVTTIRETDQADRCRRQIDLGDEGGAPAATSSSHVLAILLLLSA